MLEIIVIIYGIVTIVRGRFSLTGGRGASRVARPTRGDPLTHLVISFCCGIVIGILGKADNMLLIFGTSILSLITVIVVSQITGGGAFQRPVGRNPSQINRRPGAATGSAVNQRRIAVPPPQSRWRASGICASSRHLSGLSNPWR